MEFVEVAGIPIAVRRHGSGPCLLLLHGAVCDSRVWRREIEAFADAFTVVAWDAPGCGASSDPPVHFRMAEYAECLVGLVDALDLAPLHVLGHSWGSTLALELYRRHPAKVGSLILVGAYAGWSGSLPADEVQARLRFALSVAARPIDEFDPESMPGLFSDAISAERAEELRAIMGDVRPVGTAVMAHALAEADLRDVLPSIGVPTLVLAGDADQRSPLAVAESLHASIPGSTLTVLPGLGHECFLESPEPCCAAVREFLTSVRGSA